MYFGLFCLFVGAIVMVCTKSKVGNALATGEEVHQSINWSIGLFEANLIGLAVGLFWKHVTTPMQPSFLALSLVVLAIPALVIAIIVVYNINETIFETYRYFLTVETKRFYGTIITSTVFWLAIYYFF